MDPIAMASGIKLSFTFDIPQSSNPKKNKLGNKYPANVPSLFPPIEIYKKSFSHVDNEICHLLQKSVIDTDLYGVLKFAGNLNPNNKAIPIAMSEYPEKSQ